MASEHDAGRTTVRQVGPVDTIWLNMDRPNNLMIIESVMLFEDAQVDWDRLADVLQRRLVDRFPVFRQRPVDPALPLGLPHWEDDPDFDIARHIVRVQLPEPGDDTALQAYLEDQLHRPFDREHPLWEYHFIDGYGTGGSAVMARFHHALGDGAAMVEVLLSTTDSTADADLTPDPVVRERHRPEAPHGLLGAATRVVGSASAAARGALHLLEELPHLATHPGEIIDVLSLGGQTGQVAGKLLMVTTPPSPLTGVPGLGKRLAWSTPRELDAIKRTGRAAGATVNDVLLTAVSGALARYVAARGDDPVELVTMVPVNLRRPGEPLPRELGNKFALVFLGLPTGDHAPLERLSLAKQRMDAIKHSPEAVVTFGLITAIGRTNPDLERLLVDYFSNKAFGVTTNVMGPTEQRYMGGAPMTGILGWVPGSGNQSLGICILTYNGTVRVGFKADAGIVHDPEKLVRDFDESLEELLQIGAIRIAAGTGRRRPVRPRQAARPTRPAPDRR